MRSRRNRSIVLCVAALLWVAVIWGHSLTPAVISAQESGGVLAQVCAILDAVGIRWHPTNHLIRKAAHFTEYFILGVLSTSALHSMKGKYGFLFVPWVWMFVPLADETIQLFVEGRSGQLTDVWLDMAGFGGGFLTAWAVLALICQKTVKCFD